MKFTKEEIDIHISLVENCEYEYVCENEDDEYIDTLENWINRRGSLDKNELFTEFIEHFEDYLDMEEIATVLIAYFNDNMHCGNFGGGAITYYIYLIGNEYVTQDTKTGNYTKIDEKFISVSYLQSYGRGDHETKRSVVEIYEFEFTTKDECEIKNFTSFYNNLKEM